MKVFELMQFLSSQDPNAEVLIMSQQRYPFEHAVVGATDRKTLVEEYEEVDEDGAPTCYGKGEAPSDVFIVEGEQLRYGNGAAWEATREARR